MTGHSGFNSLDDLKELYRERGIDISPRYESVMLRALGPGLAYGSPAMFGITATVLSSTRMIAYNLVQNSVDEAKGAARIQVIADRYVKDDDPGLYKQMHRHVGEELKHSKLFKQLVAATGYSTDLIKVAEDDVAEVLDFDDGIEGFICRVHSIEIRSWTVLRMYQDILTQGEFPDLARTAMPLLEEIMQDEIFHVTYTGEQISRWLEDAEAHAGLEALLSECLEHTNRETWQDLNSMTDWLASNFVQLLQDESLDVKVPESRFLVGNLVPEVTLT